jgi:hypothetical protein
VKDHLRRLIENTKGDLLKKCVAREYLQARILQCLQEDGVFMRWVFQGGTALRFLYSIPRYSEDLDFSKMTPGASIGFRSAMQHIQSVFEAEGYTPGMKVNKQKTVSSAFIRFAGLPYEMGLSPHRAQTLSIRVEVDTNPPAGAVTETTLIRRHVTLNLHHHDKATLLAGKLHALLSRSWMKGRDLYDLIWYLADRSWPGPNLPFLNAALQQTGWSGPDMKSDNWRGFLRDKLISVDWEKVRADVLPFLERGNEIDLLTLDNALSLLESR